MRHLFQRSRNSGLIQLRRTRLTRARNSAHQRRLHIEALEDRRLLSITVNTLIDENDGIGVGGISLRDAIAAAASEDMIDFAPSLTISGPATISLTHGQLVINKNLTLHGPSANLMTINASGNDPTPEVNNGDGIRVFNIDDDTLAHKDVTLSGLTITGGDTSGTGGGINNWENLTLADCVITGNSATYSGGGISNGGGKEYATLDPAGHLILTNCLITNNSSTLIPAQFSYGGGIYNDEGGDVQLASTTISYNSAGNGAGIWSDGNVSANDCTILGNSASRQGGGIFGTHSSQLLSSTVTGNSGGQSGGGIVQAGGTLTVVECTLNNNSTSGSGGGISASNLNMTASTVSNNSAGTGGGISATNLTVADSTVSGNSASFGGGVELNQGNGIVTNSTIKNNSASSSGGGARLFYGSLQIENCTISANSAQEYGAGISTQYGELLLVNSTITSNTAQISGGGISNSGFGVGSTTTVDSSTILDNSANLYGGGIFNRYGELNVANTTITGNTGQIGGGISSIGGSATLTNSTISTNLANQGGGIFAYKSATFTVKYTTITGNRARAIPEHEDGIGGGVHVSLDNGAVNLDNTLIAGNYRGLSDTRDDIIGTVAARYSLVGDGSGATILNQGGNLIGSGGTPVNPLLGPLADNGGPTLTHALLAGSPAIDAGDPAAVAGDGVVPQYDQRGHPFARIAEGDGSGSARIDIGAVEVQGFAAPPALLGDYNDNGTVDAGDSVVWRKMLGAALTPYSGADGDGNGYIGHADYGVWRAHFGETLPVATTTALALDGVNDYAQASQAPSLNLAVSDNTFTIEGRFYVPSLTDNQNRRLLTKFQEYDVGIVFSESSADFLYFAVYDAFTSQRVTFGANTNLTVGWHHFAAVAAESSTFPFELNIYLDGNRLATRLNSPQVINVTTNPVAVGANVAGNGPFNGFIDEVRLSDSVRYTGPTYMVPTSPFVSDANTRALWHLDEAPGSASFADASGNGNVLTGLNGASTASAPASAAAFSNNSQVSIVRSAVPLTGKPFDDEAGQRSVVRRPTLAARLRQLHSTMHDMAVLRDTALVQLIAENGDRDSNRSSFSKRVLVEHGTEDQNTDAVDALLDEPSVLEPIPKMI